MNCELWDIVRNVLMSPISWLYQIQCRLNLAFTSDWRVHVIYCPYLRGDTALELSGDDEDGEGLLTDPNPLDLCLWELMVLAMVILAACLARSVETKLLTRSFRLPLTSGLTRSSRLLPLPPLEDAWALPSPD